MEWGGGCIEAVMFTVTEQFKHGLLVGSVTRSACWWVECDLIGSGALCSLEIGGSRWTAAWRVLYMRLQLCGFNHTVSNKLYRSMCNDDSRNGP